MADLGAVRLRALRDSGSPYYATLCRLLTSAGENRKKTLNSRARMVLPIYVTAEVRRDCERKFPGWRIVVKNYSGGERLESHMAAVCYLMSMRMAYALGADGEECIYLDANVATAVAKGVSWWHICRTSCTPRLQISYEMEKEQVTRMANAKSTSVVSQQATAVLVQLRDPAGGSLVCHNALTCRRRADVLLVDHTRTMVSLAQVVETANARGISEVRGCMLFQMEMLMQDEGELTSCPGRFVRDLADDLLSYVPKGDAGKGFSVKYSSLVSFVLNHTYYDGQSSWLVEKFLSKDGMYHYVLRKAVVASLYTFPEEYGANLYTDDMKSWVRITFPERVVSAEGISSAWRRASVVIPQSMYDAVATQMLVVDKKRLTLETLITVMRNSNNTAALNGDVVRLPDRVWSEVLGRLDAPLLAYFNCRRENMAASLRRGLVGLDVKYGVERVGTLALAWKAGIKVISSLTSLVYGSMDCSSLPSLTGLVESGVALDVVVEEVSDRLVVRHGLNNSYDPRRHGGFESWLPRRGLRNEGLVAMVRQRVAALRRQWSSAASDSGGSEGDTLVATTVVSVAGSVVGDDSGSVAVVREETTRDLQERELEGRRRELADKLMAEQDAARIPSIPRVVSSFESLARVDVVPVPVLTVDPLASAQFDYDRMNPRAVWDDEEVKPRLAVEADVEANLRMHGAINDSKRDLPKGTVIRRSLGVSAGAGAVPRCQTSTFTALKKRNVEVPSNRHHVDLVAVATEAVDRMLRVCCRADFDSILVRELENGLWVPNSYDIKEYVPKVETEKMERMLCEVWSMTDVDLYHWMMMTKGKTKPPLDPLGEAKVQQPQTILYGESGTTNAMYSAMCARWYHFFDSALSPNVKFNHRQSPVEHEVWFNSINPVRASCDRVYRYVGDIYNYDRSQDLVAKLFEFKLFLRCGLNQVTLEKWKELWGEKKAVSMMYGLVLYVVGQGLSGDWKTLLRNGCICLAVLVYAAELEPEIVVSIDVTGDDSTLELSVPLGTGVVVERYGTVFNLSAKFYEVECLEMCGKYWVLVDGWWYWVKDPEKAFESITSAVVVNDTGELRLKEKWISFRDDMRHYDNGLVMEALAEAVKQRRMLKFKPYGLIYGLGVWANSVDSFFKVFGPEEIIG